MKKLIEYIRRKILKKNIVNNQYITTVLLLELLHYTDNVAYEINDGKIIRVVDYV